MGYTKYLLGFPVCKGLSLGSLLPWSVTTDSFSGLFFKKSAQWHFYWERGMKTPACTLASNSCHTIYHKLLHANFGGWGGVIRWTLFNNFTSPSPQVESSPSGTRAQRWERLLHPHLPPHWSACGPWEAVPATGIHRRTSWPALPLLRPALWRHRPLLPTAAPLSFKHELITALGSV